MSVERIEVAASPEVVAAWRARLSEPEPLPIADKDALTSKELAKIAGLSQGRMRDRLRAGVKSGEYTKARGYRHTVDGNLASVPVYTLVEKKPARRKK